MRLKGSDLFSTKLALIVFLVGTAVFGFGYFKQISVRPVAATTEASSPVRFEVTATESSPVSVADNGSPWLKLKQGKPIGSEYVGTESAVSRFESGQLRPTAIISADTNSDGLADAISGFAGPDGGVVAIHTASREAFAPESETTLAGLRRGEFPAAFERQASVIELPIAPEFIVSGKFTGSDLDIIVGSRSSSSLYIISSDGKGGYGSPVALDMGGNVSAIAADSFAPSVARTGLAVAVNGDNGSSLIVFDGEGTLGETKLRSLALDRQIDTLVLTSPDGITLEKDLFLLGGGTLSRINAISKGDGTQANIELPFRAAAFAAGEFVRDRRAKTELAVLGENGVVYYLKNGQIDTRPITESEMRAEFAKNGRGRTKVINSEDTGDALANDWSVAEESNLGIVNTSRQSAGSLLMRSRVTGNETDDLVVINPADNKVSVLFKEPNYETNRASFTGETKSADLGFASEIAAVLPMRLNVMGQQGIAVLEGGKLEPTPIMFAPEATFVVSKTADTADGVCNADCSLREAVVAANGSAGADLITFGVSGSHQLTVGAAGENGSNGGDLDVTQSTTITGNGSASTILQGGASVGTGLDKVLSINPTFSSAFATSITGVTVRFGRNPSSFSTDGFGGGFDWEGSGTGTLSVTNAIITDNRTVDGDGGGIVATNSVAGNGTFTMSGSTVSNNIPARAAASSPFGGGVFVGTTTPYFISSSTISNNSATGSGGQGQGGGLFAFGPGGTGGNSFLTTSSIANNAAPSDAGGIYTTQRIDINPGSSITGNTSGRFGGGLFVNHSTATSTISKATITGNSATTTGSGIYLGSTTTSNFLNVSFSRIVGNTGAGLKGLATAGGTANAENNWWGCNTISTAGPCDTTGNTGAGTVDADPWLQLRITAASSPINVGQTSALTASFLLNSSNSAIAASSLDVLISRTVTWGSTLGSISGAQTTIQSNGTATATYTGTSPGAGTATATVDSGLATANITVNNPTADLSITKTDGVTNEIPGTAVTYTITASNAGPSAVTGATVADTFPATITGVTWTCVGAGGGTCTAAGSGNINDTVNLPSGGSVTYTATGTISASATGSLANTATVSSSVTDPTPVNNSATDTDTLVPTADLSITKTDGVTTEIPGTAVTYTITASNSGPSNAPGSTVADTFPATITGVTWTCVGAGGGTCAAAGSGNINDTVNLPSGGSVTYTATGTISASATGTLSNTATVAVAGGVTDSTPGNNSATDTDTLSPQADLAITKTDGVTTVTAGGSTTYTIVASNAGPSNAPGSTVADTFPATLTGTWTCVGAGGGTCTASGSGNINDTVNLPSGGSVTYTVSATIAGSATGSISNTATVATAGGVSDPTPGNNSATDTNTVAASADLSITKTDGATTEVPGTSVTYTITASNAGPSNAAGSTVADTFPATITGVTWTCVGAGGGTCTAAGSGNINDTVNLPLGGSVTYTATGTISASATGTLSNTATVAVPGGIADPTPGNNSATDTDTLGAQADLSITKTNGVTTVTAGTATTYTIVASNAGPSNAPGSTVTDTFPAAIASATWTCVGAGGGTCTASGSGNISDTVNLPAGGSVTYTAIANITFAATGSLVNTATVAAAGGVTDPTPGNNSATDTDTIVPSDTVAPTALATVSNVNAAGGTTYTFTVTYTDNNAINVSTLDSNDIVVSGPGGFSAPAAFVGVDVNTNGTPRVATYSITPPGGSWDPADAGVYLVAAQASQVADVIGNFVAAGQVGRFEAFQLNLVVDRTDDSAAANACTAAANDCSLRGALLSANTALTGDTITFDPVVFAVPQTILLANGELVINNSGTLSIVGPGANKLTINGNAASRILATSPGVVAVVSGMRLTNGNGVGTANSGRGGAVYNTGGNLTLNNMIITGNTANTGGGLNNATTATLTLNNCWVHANSSTSSGGAMQNFAGNTTNINNSSITGNTSGGSTGGGAMQANGTVNITNSTIAGNNAPGGSGGGISFNGTAITFTNVTMTGNTATTNGGAFHRTGANPVNFRNSIIAGNNGAAGTVDITGAITSHGNNVIGVVGTSTGWVGSDLQNTDPLLAPTGFYGGNGLTAALTSTSPALNAGQNCVTDLTCTGPNPAAALTSDQRGAARIGLVDIGAFELNNSANGGSYVAVLPAGLQNSAYSFQLAANNGTFTQAVTSGALPAGILLTTALVPQTATSLAGTPTVYGVFAFGITATSGANSNLTDYSLTVFAAPGTLLSVSGRITDTNGQPVKNALVIITDSGSFKRGTLTSPFGYYRFDGIPAGPGYSVSVSSKRYTFTPVTFDANLDVTGLDLVGTPTP